MSDLPAPLTPADCDLRGLPFMPLDTIRLMDSDMFALSTGDEFKAACALWCKSWQQLPAGSLPDDDRILAHLSGAGSRWCDIRDMSLRGWIKCSDGRLYHRVVAEKAIEALPRRKEFNDKKSSDADRKARERQDRKDLFAGLKAVGITPDFSIRTSELRTLAERHNVTISSVTPVTPVTGPVTAKTGTGTGTGTLPTERPKAPNIPAKPKPFDEGLNPEYRSVMEAAGFVAPPSDYGLVAKWKDAGADIEQDILPTLRRVSADVQSRTGRAPFKLQLFDQSVRTKLAEDQAEIERLRRTTARLTRQDDEQREALR